MQDHFEAYARAMEDVHKLAAPEVPGLASKARVRGNVRLVRGPDGKRMVLSVEATNARGEKIDTSDITERFNRG